MNLLDAAAIGFVVVAVILGYRSGALPQIGGLLGAIAGGGALILALPWLADLLKDLEPNVRPFVVLIALLAAVGIGESIGSTLGRTIARGLGSGILGSVDRAGGAVVGGAQALLVIWLLGGLLAFGPSARLAGLAQTSATVRALNTVLPAPTTVTDQLAELIDDSGLPDVFVGFEPLPAPPVDQPDDPEARAIARRAAPSTFKVSAATCGLISSGSGFAVAPDYVATNAHVVAGGNAVRVAGPVGLSDATVVLFDPDLDIALLHVPGLNATPLRFATSDPSRSAVGAALGYPGGGGLKVIPAAVSGRYPATGRDIYDRARVTREILELRAGIDRGDSGGPFVLADGTVGGVVFAEAKTSDDVGYALTPTSVATRIRPGLSRTGQADTGTCLR
ncbi:MAG: MarP family serine protease [Chloroflexota bacterium]